MSIIVYGGTKEIVEKQLICEHDWHGPCIDVIGRYFKCKKCFCYEYDVQNWAEYLHLARGN